MNSASSPPWVRLLYLAGIIGGLGLAAASALTGGRSAQTALPPGAMVRVNDAVIARADLVRAIKAVSAGKRKPLNEADKAAILQRLIEEELLVQRALAQGLAQSDPVLRASLANAVTRDVIARSRARPVSPVRLRDFYFRNKARFARPARVSIRAVYFPKSTARASMAAFDKALAKGTNVQILLAQFSGHTPPVPAGLMPPAKLKDYLGSAPLAALKGLGAGQWSGWVEDNGGVWRLYVANRTRARSPDLQSIRAQVEAAFRDDRDDAALRAYLDRLKRKADLAYSTDAPQ